MNIALVDDSAAAVKLSYVQLYISAKKRHKNQEHNHNSIKLIQSYFKENR